MTTSSSSVRRGEVLGTTERSVPGTLQASKEAHLILSLQLPTENSTCASPEYQPAMDAYNRDQTLSRVSPYKNPVRQGQAHLFPRRRLLKAPSTTHQSSLTDPSQINLMIPSEEGCPQDQGEDINLRSRGPIYNNQFKILAPIMSHNMERLTILIHLR